MSGQEPVLSAARYLASLGVDRRFGADAVVVYDESLVPRRRRRSSKRHPFRAVARLAADVDLVVTTPGSPVAVVTLQLLAALGVRRVVSVGAVAALHDRRCGDTVVVSSAGSDQSVIGPGSPVAGPAEGSDRCWAAAAELAAALAKAGPADLAVAHTTDLPLGQTPAMVQAARARGDVIEMELAAMFAAAPALGIQAAHVAVISDRYVGQMPDIGWRPCQPAIVEAALRAAVRLATDTLIATR